MGMITVIGSISTDFVAETKLRPAVGETVMGESFDTAFGGKGANQAVAPARLGAQVQMIGSVGDDVFGQSLIDNLVANNIDCQGVIVLEGTASGCAVITVAQGDNSIIVIAGANGQVSVEHLKAQADRLLASAMVVIQNEIPLETTKWIIDFCHHHQLPILYNPAPAMEVSRDLLDKVTYLTPNETEFEVLFQGQSREQALAAYPNKLLITLGEAGVAYHDGQKLVQQPAYLTSQVVDTTGAGDTFNGVLAYALVLGMSLAEAIDCAQLAASLSIQRPKAQGGMPTLAALRASEYYKADWNQYFDRS